MLTYFSKLFSSYQIVIVLNVKILSKQSIHLVTLLVTQHVPARPSLRPEN